MCTICIGPVCIPINLLWPVLLVLLKPAWEFIQKMMGKEVEKDDKKNDDLKSTSCCSKPSNGCSKASTVFESNLIKFSEEMNYNKLVEGDKVTIVRFTAPWCRPCKAIEPEFEGLGKKYTESLFVTVDIDEFEDVAVECRATSIPLFIAYKGGKILERLTSSDKAKLHTFVATHTASDKSKEE